MSNWLKGLLAIISILTFASYLLQWCVNQWLPYFDLSEITFWQAFSVFLLLGMWLYFYTTITNYLNDGTK